LDISPATVSRILKRLGLNRIAALEPAEPIRRYEREKPGELIHIDIKKLGRFERVGHRITGDRQKGVYFVRYADPLAATKKDEGLLGKLAFWRDDKPTVKAEQYRVAVTGAEDKSQVQVLDRSGTAESSPTASRILALLHEQLK